MEDILPQHCQRPSSSTHKRHCLKMEECIINGEKIKLPQALCENTELFQALFSVDSWNAFTEQQRRHLMQFLPSFGENDIEEKSCTLKRLFSGSEFRFGANPLNEFCEKLNAGYYRSDIVNIQKLLMKARYKEYLKKQRMYYYKVLKHSLVTRNKLLEAASDLKLDTSLSPTSQNPSPASVKRKLERISLDRRVKHRYYQELISIKKELADSSDSSFDENYPEGFIPPPFTKKHRKQICVLEESFNTEFDQPIISTLSRPDSLDLSRLVLNADNPFDMTEDKYKGMMKQFNKHHKNPHPYLKVQKKNKPIKQPIAKPSKEIKPLRKRRTRKPNAVKQSPQKPTDVVVKTEHVSVDESFKTNDDRFDFPNVDPLDTKFEKILIKQEVLEDFTICENKPDLTLEEQAAIIKEEIAMKEEQDNAVAALLKQEEEEAKINEYIKNEEKPSVLLFDEFNHHNDDASSEKASSEFLLTPESYNVALHSVVTSTTQSFKKSMNETEKPISLTETPNISEVENLTFDALSIDTITETAFNNSPSVTSCISTCSSMAAIARMSPSVTDLDNMNVMDLGPLNVEDTEPPPSRDKPPTELIHNAHSSFFSLIREIVCSTWDHRMDLRNLQKRIDTWYDNAVSPLNSWYTNELWPNLLQNAVTFLAGQCPDDLLPPEYVPYIEYKSNLDIYQWIGAGRDSDTKLTLLCDTWLKNKNEVAARIVEDESLLPFVLHDEYDFKREQRAPSPAFTRFPTDWVVTPSSPEERDDFRKQEKLRFQNPNTPFTYRIHGYQTVVGPVNMNHTLPNNSKLIKGTSLLVENRPHFVTILALVQDAAARLPNGEGTRQDIVTLLKDSQYLSQNIMNCILHGAVTYSLERLQLETDPCVKYDTRRKIWIYLHRSRTMSDFESIEAVKPKNARKTGLWKLKKEYVPLPSVATVKTEGVTFRAVKETKPNVRVAKNTPAAKSRESKPAAKRTVTASRNVKPDNKSKLLQPALIQAVISDPALGKNVEKTIVDPQIVNIQPSVMENARTILRAADLKNVKSVKTTRPPVIKKAVVKGPVPISSVASTNVKTSVSEAKSIRTSTGILSPNTIVKLINAKSLTSDGGSVLSSVKGAKTLAQISPQQIVVIKHSDEGTSSPDKKHTVLLKQMQPAQNPHRLTLANVQKTQQRSAQQTDQQTHIGNAEMKRTNEMVVTSETIENISKQDLLEKHQKQLQQLLVKHQNELKLQQCVAKEPQSITVHQTKTLPKQMIVIKQNQGQIVAERQNVEEEAANAQTPKQVSSPLVILNKQQYQQQLQNPKHQIIQLSGQQLSTQQIQQMLLKQQQQMLKRNNQQQPQQQQQQQIVMLKSDVQQQGQQQIVMLKQPTQQHQQQLVMIKQPNQQGQKVQPKSSQPQIIQIANSAGIMTPISTDLKLQTGSVPTTRIQKIQTSVTPTILQNSKTSVIAAGTTISVSVSKPTMPTYTVVALGQQQKVFTQNNQNVQILTSTANTVNANQAVMLPTSSGGLTLLQQGSMQQVLLPSNFTSPGMINLKTLQGLKVIPISAQTAGSLKGQSVITRLVNSNAIRPVVIQEDRSLTSSTGSNISHQ